MTAAHDVPDQPRPGPPEGSGAAATDRSAGVQVQVRRLDRVPVVGLSGSLRSLSDALPVRRALAKVLAEHPDRVVCDLSDLDFLDPSCVGLFTAAANAMARPGTLIVLLGGHGQAAETLSSHGVGRFLPVVDSWDTALHDPGLRTPRPRERLLLTPEPLAAARARGFLRRVCTAWQLPHIAPDATLLASELVTNAIKHAATDVELWVELAPGMLLIRVRDRSLSTPRLQSPDQSGTGGRGLRLVEALSLAWGHGTHPAGGKVVWCALRTRP
jgi:anti-anti-sigma factor